MLQRLGQILIAFLMLGFLFDPSLTDIKNTGNRVTHFIFGTPDTDPAESIDKYATPGNSPDQPGFDSMQILQEIDSVQSGYQHEQIPEKLLRNKLQN